MHRDPYYKKYTQAAQKIVETQTVKSRTKLCFIFCDASLGEVELNLADRKPILTFLYPLFATDRYLIPYLRRLSKKICTHIQRVK